MQKFCKQARETAKRVNHFAKIFQTSFRGIIDMRQILGNEESKLRTNYDLLLFTVL